MRNLVTSILIVSSSIVGFAQETFQFNPKYISNSVYLKEYNYYTTGEILSVNNKLKDSKIDLRQIYILETKTKSKLLNEDLPFESKFVTLKIESIENRKKKIKDVLPDLINLKVNGIENEKGRKTNSIEENVSEKNKQTLMLMITDINNIFPFIVETFRVNESKSFIQFIGNKAKGAGNVIISTYKLLSIKDHIATFEIKKMLDKSKNPSSDSFATYNEYSLKGFLTINLKDQNEFDLSLSGNVDYSVANMYRNVVEIEENIHSIRKK
ncbi:hypothetical protein [Empedobacter brevis]